MKSSCRDDLIMLLLSGQSFPGCEDRMRLTLARFKSDPSRSAGGGFGGGGGGRGGFGGGWYTLTTIF